MRTETTLPHDVQKVGRLWNGSSGNYDNWGRLPITTIVLHSMDGTTDGSTAWFKKVNQSAHYGVSQNGKITLWIPENCVAYHAGKYSVNQVSIGIEHEDLGNNQNVRPQALYDASIKLVAELSKEYGIPLDKDHIKIHREIVNTACPGTLDRDRIINGAKALLTGPEEPLVSHMLKPSVFAAMVTKSSEYDDTWSAFQLPDDLKTNIGSHQMILDKVQAQLSEAKSISSSQVPVAVNTSPVAEIPENQSKSILQTDILEMLKSMFSSWKSGK